MQKLKRAHEARAKIAEENRRKLEEERCKKEEERKRREAEAEVRVCALERPFPPPLTPLHQQCALARITHVLGSHQPP